MIDLHSHILPNMDDGSKSPEQTQKLLELLREQGVTTLAATPHFYAGRENPESFLRRREESLQKMPVTELPLLVGAEVAYFPGMAGSDALTQLRLGDTQLLLLEMPFCDWNSRIIEDVCDIPLRLGLTPVLAHVDRYRGREQMTKYRELLLENDILFQCNADAFEGFWKRRWALEAVRLGHIHFLGSDCHNTASRPPKLDIARDAICSKLGEAAFAELQASAQQRLQ